MPLDPTNWIFNGWSSYNLTLFWVAHSTMNGHMLPFKITFLNIKQNSSEYQCLCLKQCCTLPVSHILSGIYFSGTNWRNKVGGTLCYLSLHVCLCWCLSVRADSRVSAISLLPSSARPSSSTDARKSIVWKRESGVKIKYGNETGQLEKHVITEKLNPIFIYCNFLEWIQKKTVFFKERLERYWLVHRPLHLWVRHIKTCPHQISH